MTRSFLISSGSLLRSCGFPPLKNWSLKYMQASEKKCGLSTKLMPYRRPNSDERAYLRIRISGETDRTVVHLVTGSIHPHNWIFARQSPDILKLFSVFLKFCDVSLAEFVPALRVMGKPFSQFGARRNLFGPLINSGRFLGQPAWPKSIHEDATPSSVEGFS